MQQIANDPVRQMGHKGKDMGGHARQQWMYEARELSEMMEKFQLNPSDEQLKQLYERLRLYQDSVRKNDIQLPQSFKSY